LLAEFLKLPSPLSIEQQVLLPVDAAAFSKEVSLYFVGTQKFFHRPERFAEAGPLCETLFPHGIADCRNRKLLIRLVFGLAYRSLFKPSEAPGPKTAYSYTDR